jgi:hypothetical protein
MIDRTFQHSRWRHANKRLFADRHDTIEKDELVVAVQQNESAAVFVWTGS